MLILAIAIPERAHRTEDERNTIAVFSKAKLGVVHIKALRVESTEFGAHQHSESTGSGFLVDDGGHVLTSSHVIESANRIEVYLPDGVMAVARLIGTAPTLDVAVLRVDLYEPSAHEPLRLGDSETVVIGQKVIVVGHPLLLHNTVTVGVVRAVRRSLSGVPAELQGALLQTDAA